MNEKICDRKSVGVFVEKDGKLLLIQRKKFPAGFALPAGHCDGDAFRIAAERELREETGLEPLEMEYLFGDMATQPCRRGGKYHYWQLFRATQWQGELKRSEDETKSIEWADKKRIEELMAKTEAWAKRYNIPLSDIAMMTTVFSNDHEWQSSPGLEPVWYCFLKKLHQM